MTVIVVRRSPTGDARPALSCGPAGTRPVRDQCLSLQAAPGRSTSASAAARSAQAVSRRSCPAPAPCRSGRSARSPAGRTRAGRRARAGPPGAGRRPAHRGPCRRRPSRRVIRNIPIGRLRIRQPGNVGSWHQHQRVERVAVLAQGVRHEAVVGRVLGRGEQRPVQPDQAAFVVDLVLVPAAPRDLDHDVEFHGLVPGSGAACRGAAGSAGRAADRSTCPISPQCTRRGRAARVAAQPFAVDHDAKRRRHDDTCRQYEDARVSLGTAGPTTARGPRPDNEQRDEPGQEPDGHHPEPRRPGGRAGGQRGDDLPGPGRGERPGGRAAARARPQARRPGWHHDAERGRGPRGVLRHSPRRRRGRPDEPAAQGAGGRLLPGRLRGRADVRLARVRRPGPRRRGAGRGGVHRRGRGRLPRPAGLGRPGWPGGGRGTTRTPR